jgi:tetratricopeptide (TPR) repeat protein
MRSPKLNSINKGAFLKGRILRVTLFTGLILLVLSAVIIFCLNFFNIGNSKTARQQNSFYSLLREYDLQMQVFARTDREAETLNGYLDNLEKNTVTVESWLSVLKRRKILAKLHKPSAENYHNSIKHALEAYPMSQPLAAIAAAAVVKDTAINKNMEASLREWLPLLTEPAFNSIRLNLHILLGDLNGPQKTPQLPKDLVSDGTEEISVNLALAKTLRGDLNGAAADIYQILNSPSPLINSIRFAAEYYYDFGDPGRSAKLFSLIDDDTARIREADALYLAGFTNSARAIWLYLAASPETALSETSLYNMAVTAPDQDEAFAFLEKLVMADVSNIKDSPFSAGKQFGLIRYSRFLPYNQAITVLAGTKNLELSGYPYIDLEISKRHAQGPGLGRQLAETWLLLDRHPENEDLYQWAAWFMFFQRHYDEAKILLNRLEYLPTAGHWFSFYKAVQAMREGSLEAAEQKLLSISGETPEWQVYANLGCIYEANRSFSRALKQYELSFENLQITSNYKTASRLQFRIANCSSALGHAGEVRKALEYALYLDPDNQTARFEHDKLFMP